MANNVTGGSIWASEANQDLRLIENQRLVMVEPYPTQIAGFSPQKMVVH